MATLRLLLGQADQSRRLASEILAELAPHPRDARDETVWILATLAEAHLLLAHCAEAAELYQQEILHPKFQPHNRDAMAKQVQRILRLKPCAGTDFSLIFGEEATHH